MDGASAPKDDGATPLIEADEPPLSIRTKAFYGLGESVSGITQTATDTFLLFYLTAVVGLSGTRAGTALFIALLVDSVADPLIGYASDNTRSRWGRRHPYLFASVIPLAVTVGLLYSTPHIDGQWLLFVCATSVLLLLRISFSVYALPFIALGAELSRDYRERSVIQSYRTFFWIAAYGVTIYIGLGLFLSGENGLLNRPAYAGFGWTCTGLVVIVGLLSACYTFKDRPPLPRTRPHHRVGVAHLFGEVRDVARNPSFLVLFLTVLTFWVAQGVAGSL
jgi:glycoside/pentoside/hexuronide:cation symporter, GPH family